MNTSCGAHIGVVWVPVCLSAAICLSTASSVGRVPMFPSQANRARAARNTSR
jgi:hypothetical protein